MIYKRLLKYLRPYYDRLGASLLCMSAYSGITGLTMWLVKNVIDKIFIAKDTHMLYMITWLVPLIFLVKGIAGYGQNYLMYYIAQNIVRTLRNELYEKLMSLSHDYYSKNATPKLMARVTNDVSVLQNALFRVPPSIIRDGLTVIVMIGIVFYLNWKFAIITLFVFPVAAVPLVNFAKKMRDASRQGQKQMGELYGNIQETLVGISVIKAFLKENDEIARFRKENDIFYETQQRFIRVDARSSPIMEFIGAVAVSFILWYGGKDVIDGVWSAGSFFAFFTAVFSIYQPLKNFASTNSIIQQSAAAAERVFEVIDEKPTILNAPDAKVMPEFGSDIHFENITFHYPEKEDALKNIDLKINKGEVVAIVGPSGSGKTTLTSLLFRFYDPQRGKVLIDGQDIKKATIESLRSKMGIVTQDVILFNETIKYNISYGNKDATMDEIINASKSANAYSFIERMPNRYDSLIGERGVRLSGGEKQRLSIARAILKNPPILVLDEATSALDAESEKLVQEAIERLMQGRTVFVIAHRLATIKKADRIVVLDKGVITEQGTHEELLNNEGIYKKLHYLQILDS
jgi:subfamily B ATP-binding cassette protein MsbA